MRCERQCCTNLFQEKQYAPAMQLSAMTKKIGPFDQGHLWAPSQKLKLTANRSCGNVGNNNLQT